MEKKKRKVDLLNVFNLVFMILLIVSAVLLVVQLYSKLPILYVLAVVVILLIVMIAIRVLATRKRGVVRKIALVLTLIFLVLSSFGNYYIYRTNHVLSTIGGANVDIIQYSVLVSSDSSFEEVGDLKDASSFDIMVLGDTEFNDEAIAELEKDLGDTALEVKENNSLQDAYDKVINDDSAVLIINEGLRSMFLEAGHDLDTNTKVIKTYNFERERQENANAVDVTNSSFIVYISGIDIYGPISLVSRSDVNKLMVVNPETKHILLIDIPRDYFVEQPCQMGQKDKLTHTGIFGVDCTVDAISDYFGVDINYYARVNFTSLINIVDALGGIEVNSAYDFCSGQYCYVAGQNHLNGDEALMFSRERYSLPNGDNDRIENQSRVLQGIINKVTSPAIIANYLDFMDVLADSVETNLTSDDIDKLIKMQLNDMASWTIESFAVSGTGATEYSPANGFDSYVMWPDDESVAEALDKIYTVMNEH